MKKRVSVEMVSCYLYLCLDNQDLLQFNFIDLIPIMMDKYENGDNTQRVISNQKLILDVPEKAMTRKKKIIIGISVFLTLAAITGLIVGLVLHYRPSSKNIQTVVSQTNDGNVHLSTKFQYTENNMVGDDVNQEFTVMFAGLNSSSARRRMLQTAQGQEVNSDTTLHYTHESGIKIKFRGNVVLNISVPIDQVVEYIAQQQDPQAYARFLQEDITQYGGQDQLVAGSDIYNMYRDQVLESIQSIYENSENVHVYMTDIDMYEMDYDENSGLYKYTDNATSVAQSRRRLWSFRHFFHRVGSFFKKAAGDVVHFVKKDGLKILKYGAIAALAGIDIAAKGSSGISDAVKMFKSGNVLTSLEMTAEGVVEGVAPYLPAQFSIPIQFIAQACFSNPPKMHCTKKGAINAAKDQVVDYVRKHAISTALSLLQ